MDTKASETEVSQEELARESLMAISQCIPEVILTSNLLPDNSSAANVVGLKDSGGAEEYRSKLISISYTQSPEIYPSPSLPENLPSSPENLTVVEQKNTGLSLSPFPTYNLQRFLRRHLRRKISKLS